MKLTTEQDKIVKTDDDSKINAIAGSGKTSTLIEFAKSKPKNTKILYLVFNKSAKIDAQEKFMKREVYNVQIETAHSLAFSAIVVPRGYKINHSGYKTSDLMTILDMDIKNDKDQNINYILTNHVKKMMSMYCNSSIVKLVDFDYKASLTATKAKEVVDKHYDVLIDKFKLFWNLMDTKRIDSVHDFYLKKYHLSKPTLNFDYILFDEGQDASEVMLDIFKKQDSVKLIVGDTHQQIYGWRYAINSLEKTDFQNFYLTNSFRFGKGVADLANSVLGLKKILNPDLEIIEINGKGKSKSHKSHAVIARTNIGLLMKAIEYCGKSKGIDSVYFEGNLYSYTYASEGTSLYDVLNLYLNKKQYIKDKFIKELNGFYELEEFVESVEDGSLKMLIDIVKEYGGRIPNIIKNIKDKNVDHKEDAQIIFTTVHKSKGIEYDSVELANDFITEKKIRKSLENIKNEKTLAEYAETTNEEINMLYVALTRTKNKLFIPQQMIPNDCYISGNIFALNSFNIALHNEAKIWTYYDDQDLISMKEQKKSIKKMAYDMQRSEAHIRLRLSELEDNKE